MKMILILLFLSNFWLSILNSKNTTLKKKKKELIPIACHPKRWWNFCLTEDEKIEIETTFIEGL